MKIKKQKLEKTDYAFFHNGGEYILREWVGWCWYDHCDCTVCVDEAEVPISGASNFRNQVVYQLFVGRRDEFDNLYFDLLRSSNRMNRILTEAGLPFIKAGARILK